MAGLICLAFAVNLLTSFLGALTLITYLFVYTPLKRKTWLNTAVGAIPGALPPLMGWTAARNDLDASGWSLSRCCSFGRFLIFWRCLALSRGLRERRIRHVAFGDADGFRTGRQAVSHTFGLLFHEPAPVALGLTGVFYFGGAVLLGEYFLFARFGSHEA